MIKKIIKRIVPNRIKVFIMRSKRDLSNVLKKNKVLVTDDDFLELSKIEGRFPHVLNTKETIDYIKNNRASMCRFGDAEFDISNQENNQDEYQKPSDKLSKRLHNILMHGSEKDLILCIPPFNSKTNNIKNYYGKLSFWEWYWLNKFNKIEPLLTKDIYGNSFATRETVFYENHLSKIKAIWEGRDVVFVYGEKGRFNSEHKIFNNINKKNEILISPTSAFDYYENILEQCTNYDNASLFLIAAGPTATVLAFDLWHLGYQALDIGHLPNSYDEFTGEILSPESIPLVS